MGGALPSETTISELWRARRDLVPIEPVMRFSSDGLVLGSATVLAARGPSGGPVVIEDLAHISALLAAAHLRRPDGRALAHLRRAVQRWNDGDEALAAMHLALSRLDRLARPPVDAKRLFYADVLLGAGLAPHALERALGLPEANVVKYDPDQPRVPAGSGRASGQWAATGASGASPPPPPPNANSAPATRAPMSSAAPPRRPVPPAMNSPTQTHAETQAVVRPIFRPHALPPAVRFRAPGSRVVWRLMPGTSR